MTLTIINSIASWFLKKRLHQIEYFQKYPNEVQQELLMQLISTAKTTEFGCLHHFGAIKNYQDFHKQVPLSHYEDLEPYISRARKKEGNILWPYPIKWFAKSSGTTNAKSKFIPVSSDALENCHFKAGKDMLCVYLNNNENSQLFTGKSLRLGGSKELYEDNNTFFGDLSAIIIDNLPFWAELSSTPSHKVSLMSEWIQKMQAIVEETKNVNVTSLAGVPSWMMVLLNHVLEQTNKKNLHQLWPNAEVYFHGGVSFQPYKEQYRHFFPKPNFRYYEIYNASEGFFALQDKNNSNELLLMLDYGIFYEFIPMDSFNTPLQKIIPLAEVELNKNYALVITTNSGLWRYLIGDTVRFTSLLPYRIKITGRTKHFINVFGEELMIENTDKALAKTSNAFSVEIIDYTVAPVFMNDKEKGAHQWIIEFRNPPENVEAFAKKLDEELQQVNSDYEAKRYKNITLNNLFIEVGRKNVFQDWLKLKNKLGGQNKIPRLSNDRTFLEEIIKLNK